MKRRNLLLMAVSSLLLSFVVSCSPEEPVFNLKFRYSITGQGCDNIICNGDGKDCAKVGDHHIIHVDGKNMLDRFYTAVNADTVQRFFETEDWHQIFPENTITPAVQAEIASYNYSVLIAGGDSSIVFVRHPADGFTDDNVIFAFSRQAPGGCQ